jgi:uncharacterized RDD family membrane protein YckC
MATGPYGIQPISPEAPVYRLSGWGSRVGATIIDSFIVGIIGAVAGSMVGVDFGFAKVGGGVNLSFIIVMAATIAAYSGGLLTYNNGQTFGKRSMGIRVVREDGRPIELGWAIYREVFSKYLLGSLTFGLYALADDLWPLGDKQNRAIHDMIVKSRVVDK